MLWGGGTVDAQDAQRLKDFSQISTVPPYVLGFEEPDCLRGSGSADMSVAEAVEKWESLMAPMKKKGAKLGSPSMCSAFPFFFFWYGQSSEETDFFLCRTNRRNLACRIQTESQDRLGFHGHAHQQEQS